MKISFSERDGEIKKKRIRGNRQQQGLKFSNDETGPKGAQLYLKLPQSPPINREGILIFEVRCGTACQLSSACAHLAMTGIGNGSALEAGASWFMMPS